MTVLGHTLFETTIGRCGIAWTDRGITTVRLPGATDAETRERTLDRAPGAPEAAPPPDVQRAIDAMSSLLRGEPRDLSDIVLDMHGISPFHRRVYEVARTIPVGATLSYGEIAVRLGAHGAARAVGQALGRNPFPVVVPCHRVLAANGKLGGFTAHGGVTTKLRMLAIERAATGGATLPLDPELAIEHRRASSPRSRR